MNVRLPERMKYVRLPDRNSAKYGFGQQQIVTQGISPALFPETDPVRHVPDYGSHFRLITVNVLLFIQISGNHTEMFSLRNVCVSPEKRAAEQRILNVLTVLYVGDVPARCGKHSLSVKMRKCTKNGQEYLSITVMPVYQFKKNYYQTLRYKRKVVQK